MEADMEADLVMAGLGSADKCEIDGAPVLPRRPKELEHFLRHHIGRNSRPDVIILRKGVDGTKTISIIEFKYCKDTDQTRGPTGKMHDTTLFLNSSSSGRWV